MAAVTQVGAVPVARRDRVAGAGQAQPLGAGARAVGEADGAEGGAALAVGLDRTAGRGEPADEGEAGADVVVHVLPGDEAGALVDLRDGGRHVGRGGEVAGRDVEHDDVLRGVHRLVGVAGLARDPQRAAGDGEVGRVGVDDLPAGIERRAVEAVGPRDRLVDGRRPAWPRRWSRRVRRRAGRPRSEQRPGGGGRRACRSSRVRAVTRCDGHHTRVLALTPRPSRGSADSEPHR